MSLDKIIEEKIAEAMERGEFDNLRGRGKPLNLEEYFKLPEHLRAGYMVLKNAGFLPAEAEALREIETLREKLDCCGDEEQKKRIEREIERKKINFNVIIEKNRRAK